ncbi:MAG: aminoglycoside phosphotransferase family protein [Gaiellaceae bacterium]
MIEERVTAAVRRPVRSLRRIQTRGYAQAFHAIADLDDGSTAFVKAGAEDVTSEFLRQEIRFYEAVQGSFMPTLLGYDAGNPPLLVIEDLSAARWPPPWDACAIDEVRATLGAVWSTPAPPWVPPITEDREKFVGGWAEIERDPTPFLSLGAWSAGWLDECLPTLRGAAERAPIEGDALLHLDVRSDNLCLADRGAVLVDWNFVHLGNPDLDLAGWAASLHLEGGPPPHELLPGAGGLAAVLAGFFASRAGLPPPPTARGVRAFQLAQARVAIPWALRELGLRSET